MQFHAAFNLHPQLAVRSATAEGGIVNVLSVGSDTGGGGEPPPPPNPIKEITQNLLKHIPGEASGFYMMALGLFEKPTTNGLFVIFAMALFILLLVRWLAGASAAIMITSVLAFVIWMACFDQGYIYVAFPSLCPRPWGALVALFYSTVVTLLASAGKIR